MPDATDREAAQAIRRMVHNVFKPADWNLEDAIATALAAARKAGREAAIRVVFAYGDDALNLRPYLDEMAELIRALPDTAGEGER